MSTYFFGYPGRPRSLVEVLRITSDAMVKAGHDARTWEDLSVGGRVVISVVLDAIQSADFSVFDVTSPNPNVLFEAGYAVGIGKPMWLTLDTTVATATKAWKDLGLLKPIGYKGYRNSQELRSALRDTNPADTVAPLYDTLIEPAMPEAPVRSTLLYCPTYEPYEASNRLSTLIDRQRRRGLEVISADPTESSYPLFWYAEKLAGAAGVLLNFAGQSRNLSEVHNLRYAFVAGLATGLEVPTLMLSEDDYARPFDYEHLLHVYDTSASCVGHARPWLQGLVLENVVSAPKLPAPKSRLAGLRLGEHVAENELSDLQEYFIETSAFHEVMLARDSLFVGHRGTGKTANALRAFEEISSNKENLAVLIKPAGFEFPGLLAAIDQIPDHTHEYLFDSLWRFIVQTELAATVVQQLDSRPAYIPTTSAEAALLRYVEQAPFQVRDELSVRLNQALAFLTEAARLDAKSIESGRDFVNEAFHETALIELRHVLGGVLSGKKRVAVIIDNLDKGWQRSARLEVLALLILGLLSARGHIVRDFRRQDWWRDEIKLTMAVFLRSDIFSYVRRAAREPDKLSISSIAWRDKELLDAVLEERLRAAWTRSGPSPELWGDVFCAEYHGRPTRDVVGEVLLPRPRDFVFFMNAALARAVDRRKSSVTQDEISAAFETYSQYAYEALLVENGITIPEMEHVLYGFLGEEAIVARRRVQDIILKAGVPEDKQEAVVSRLIEMSFLGVEAEASNFVFPEVGPELTRCLAQSRRLQPDDGDRRLLVHPAFRPFLGVVASADA